MVRLIAITKPVDDIAPDAQGLISYCARVSNPSNQSNFDTAGKLLSYCMKHKHWSVFEMASMVIEIETTRDVARQILRHRSMHFQEASLRYAEVPDLLYKECRGQDSKNRQNSLPVEEDVAEAWQEIQEDVASTIKAYYKHALNLGIAREVARSILPEGMAITRMYMHGTVRDFYHYCAVRTGPETQKEHRDIANEIQKILFEQFPSLKEAVHD